MTKSIARMLKKIFKLPSIEKRNVVGVFWRKRVFADMPVSHSDNGVYILCLQYKYRLIAGWILASALLLTYKLQIKCGIGLFKICISHNTDFAVQFSKSFGILFALLDLFVIFPIFYCLFRFNVDWNNKDYLMPSQKLPENISKEELKRRWEFNFPGTLFLMSTFYLGAPFVGLFFSGLLNLARSEIYLLIMAAILPVFLTEIWSALFILALSSLRIKNKLHHMK